MKRIKNLKIILIATGITVFSLLLTFSGVWQRLENMVSDGLYQKPAVIPDDIKIIAIDEETLERLGPYTNWDRGYFAALIDKLNQNEESAPRLIAFDIIFSGTDGSETDALLAETVGRYENIMLASLLNVDSYLVRGGDGRLHSQQYVASEGKPYERLAQNAPYGFTNAIFDADGIVRRTYSQYRSEYNGTVQVYDSFAYAVASSVADVKTYPTQVEPLFVGMPGEFESISMAAVLDGKIPGDYFADAIVLVGAYEEGLMDFYRVPNDYAEEMYGVELQANFVYAFLHDRMVHSVDGNLLMILAAVVIMGYAFFALRSGIRKSVIALAGILVGYPVLGKVLFAAFSYKLTVLTIPGGVAIAFLVSLLYRYVEMQKRRAAEMQETLFSMAEAMAEAIEGRTPYNANHTKNVAKRCVEMLDFINQKHREKKTELHFSDAEKRELYLAAMLHDVGKMDVPLEVMDKPTKLGGRERQLRDRLRMIQLRLEIDALRGDISEESAREKKEKLDLFTEKLNGFNCGRPLKEDEWALVDEIAGSIYAGTDGEEIPYLTGEEIDDLHIKAGTLSGKEREIMQSHVVYTDKILSHINFGEQFAHVRAMASNHHELLNGRGYPNQIDASQLDVMTRILTIMDIYDSLIADDRPYKKPKPVPVAFGILDEEAEAGKIDRELLAFAKELYLKEEVS